MFANVLKYSNHPGKYAECHFKNILRGLILKKILEN